MITWSYSSLKTFEQCPKKYFHLKVVKDVKDEGSEATIYGQEVHSAAEEFIKNGTPVPAKFKFIKPTLESLNSIEGVKHCEMKLGLKLTDDGYAPCEFFDKDVWWRGIADLVIINGSSAYSVDYKTSKNAKYADTKQLDAVAFALFHYFPELETIKSALAFVVSDEFIKKNHYREHMDNYIKGFEPMLDRLSGAMETDMWNPISGPLCRFCPVVQCEHNSKR
jgi:ATP-dependent exoDNAse (exonuclease V) beta subunit